MTSLTENFVYLHANTSSTVEFSYDDGVTSHNAILASLDTGDTLLADVNLAADTAKVFVKSDDMPDLGTYLLSTEIKPCQGSSNTKNLIVYHEEEIQGFQVFSIITA